jgi:crossover junction endodeoxyribonuclease RusA
MAKIKNPMMFERHPFNREALNVTSAKMTHGDASTAETVTVILPLPARRLSPNCTVATRGGRFAKAAAVKKYRTMAKEAVEAAYVETGPWEHAVATVTFFWADGRRRDEDNAIASLKAAYDGIVEAGLIVDDDSRHLRREMPVFLVDKKNPRVEIVVTRMD